MRTARFGMHQQQPTLFFRCCCCVLHSIKNIEYIWATILTATDHMQKHPKLPTFIFNLVVVVDNKLICTFFRCYSVKSKRIRFIKLKLFGVFHRNHLHVSKLNWFASRRIPIHIPYENEMRNFVGILRKVNNEANVCSKCKFSISIEMACRWPMTAKIRCQVVAFVHVLYNVHNTHPPTI